MLVLRAVRCERRTSLTVNVGCWHALPMGIHATLMLAPGCSSWRPKSEPTTSPDARHGRWRRGRHATRDIRPIVGRRCGAWPGWQCAWLVALRGPGRPGSHIRCRPPCWAWLSNDVPACRGLAVAWLKRGARAPRGFLDLG